MGNAKNVTFLEDSNLAIAGPGSQELDVGIEGVLVLPIPVRAQPREVTCRPQKQIGPRLFAQGHGEQIATDQKPLDSIRPPRKRTVLGEESLAERGLFLHAS